MIHIIVKARFLDIPNSVFKGWDRFCHVVYPLVFALRATPQQVGKAGGLQILCCQGINVTDYNFNLDALALKPSDFCNVWGGSVKQSNMKFYRFS